MAKTQVYDFKKFVRSGELVRLDETFLESLHGRAGAFVAGGALGAAGFISSAVAHAKTLTETAVPALAQGGDVVATAPVSIDHAFDPVITMLQQMSFPVASIVIAWACLRAMTGHPAAAVDQAKWAVLGYLAMRYVPTILRHI